MRSLINLIVAFRRAAFTCAVALCVGACLGASGALANSAPRPVSGSPYGKSYGEWAALWWQWVLQTTVAANPAIDAIGANCTIGQRGEVWFLAGVLGGGTVERNCRVPANVALLVPLINNVWLSTLGDSAYGLYPGDPRLARHARELRSHVACVRPARVLSLRIDGKAVTGLDRFGENSVFFAAQVPSGGVLGSDQALLTPNVDSGYYVIFRPLPSGSHRLHWIAEDGCGHRQDVTYRLRVG